MQGPIRGATSSRKREQRMHKYLKPGALAQLRDARISARRCSVLPASEPSIARINLPNQGQSPLEEAPCFSVRSFGPSFPQRKKLMASKAFLMGMVQSTPSSPTGVGIVDPRPDLLLDTLPVDILAVH